MKYVVMILGLFISAAVLAQDSGQLNVKTTVQKELLVEKDNGEIERQLVAADSVVPGDNVIYTITFTNIGTEATENVVIVNPIAENLSYIEGSAFGPGTKIEFSADGGESFAAAEELMVASSEGQRPATIEDYTHLRWTLLNDLAAGAQGMAQFRARLD